MTRMRYGLTPSQWQAEVLAAQTYLQELASREEGPITYTQLFDALEQQGHRRPEMFQASSGEILGDVAMLEIEAKRPPLTALVVNQDSQRPGGGFRKMLGLRSYAERYGSLDVDTAWIAAIRDVHEFWTSRAKTDS